MKKIPKRRRIEAKTDYRARLALLKSGKPRLIIRKTNRYIIAQIVESSIAQDKVIIHGTSKDLLAKGWPQELRGSLKSLPAAYILGLMIGRRASSKVKEAVLDIGMHRNVKNSRIYAVLKGVLDAGLSVPHSKDSLPSIEFISSNRKLSNLIDKLKDKV